MLKLINALKVLSVVLLAVNLLMAQEADSSEKIYLSYEKKVYLKGSLDLDSIRGFIAAEYCLNPDTGRVWVLLNYKQFIPLTIKIQTESFSKDDYLEASLDADIKFGYWLITGGGSRADGDCYRDKWCRYILKINEEYNIIYDIFDTLYINDANKRTIDTARLSSVLFDKVFPVKWHRSYALDKQQLNISGSYNIRISDFCTKEQLKKIEKDKKANGKSKIKW